jgi:hypothetical protein
MPETTLAFDLFTELFGRGRGVPGREREDAVTAFAPPLTSSGLLVDILCAREALPGLTLLSGGGGDGKTVAAVFLAAQLARKGVKTAYLHCADTLGALGGVASLLNSQIPVLPSTVSDNILLSHQERDAAINYATRLIAQNMASFIIIDELSCTAFDDLQRMYERVRSLAALARSSGVGVLATCAPESVIASTQVGLSLSLLTQMNLHTRKLAILGPSNPAQASAFFSITAQKWESARMRVDSAGLISLV